MEGAGGGVWAMGDGAGDALLVILVLVLVLILVLMARTVATPNPARDLTSNRFGGFRHRPPDWSQAFLARMNALVLTGRSRIQ